jgi:hypothetical protein
MLITIMLYMAYIGINSIIMSLLIKLISHPKYSLPIHFDRYSIYSTILLFLGIFVLPFYKILRKRRIREFYEYAEKHRYSIREFNMICGVNITEKELDNLRIIIKLEKIKNKSKRKHYL